ncbi:hypothetical protein [Comamonas thiooxydans]|uniref:hypothetical protein n=1 Tax=Comamonas thiooxydans TaxID=363952 RepID=UPI000B421758|nr:hypothetical protein [Comamonas thiooxydans]
MHEKYLSEGDTVKDSPRGPGTITGVTAAGFPQVNHVAVAWLERTDGVIFDPRGVREAAIERARIAALSTCDRPLAAPGLLSYRCQNRYGWTMIGAKDDEDALAQAKRSSDSASMDKLQKWNGQAYVPVTH